MSAPAESAELLGASSGDTERERERVCSPLSGLDKCHISTFFFICCVDEETLAGVEEFVFLMEFY